MASLTGRDAMRGLGSREVSWAAASQVCLGHLGDSVARTVEPSVLIFRKVFLEEGRREGLASSAGRDSRDFSVHPGVRRGSAPRLTESSRGSALGLKED